MATLPEISIIVPTYNHGHLIKRCIDSIIRQTFTNWEAIIVNNFSEDNTIEVIKSFTDPRVLLVNIRNDGVIAVSRNKGISLAKGRYIAFLDSDDWWYPEKLEASMRRFDSADIVFHDLDIHTPNGKTIIRKAKGRHLARPVFADLMTGGNALCSSSVIVKKSIVHKVGGFSESRRLISIEDFDLWLKIARITDQFIYIPKALGNKWIWSQNTTEISERKIEQIKEVYEKYWPVLGWQDRKQSELHMLYSIARIKQRMGKWQEALGLFKVALKSKKSKDRLKSLFFVIIISSFRRLSVRI
ncbi:glycosyltransferase [candidate division KSB1 bacterium]|nr:glycosyltransferase [candidate division KSB1 bacterium]